MIELLSTPAAERDVAGLTALLLDAVEGGASVSFMAPLRADQAEAFWRESLDALHPRAAVLIARDQHGIAGTVQLQPAWAPNQPHRAEVAKLLVHSRARRRGLGKALMGAVEAHAAATGFSLLTLDTRRGDAGEALYRGLGWIEAGIIPDYAVVDDGSFCDTVIFYKRVGLRAPASASRAASTPPSRSPA